MPISQSHANAAAFRCQSPAELAGFPLPAGSHKRIQGIDPVDIFGSDRAIF
jgi:hypothetical protein